MRKRWVNLANKRNDISVGNQKEIQKKYCKGRWDGSEK
jgi:hypothetical protein